MKIVSQHPILTPRDVLRLGIVDLNRRNGIWENAADALDAISSWLIAGQTVATVVEFARQEWYEYAPAPIAWDHIGAHQEIGAQFSGWFCAAHAGGELQFSDSPDFYGRFASGALFWGDIGECSASTFNEVIRWMRAHDLWVSVLDGGTRHILLEPSRSIFDLFSAEMAEWCGFEEGA